MGTTTILRKGPKFVPESETQFRKEQALHHRKRGFPGDEAWAKTHERAIQDIRGGKREGSTRLNLCPRCLERGYRYTLLEIDDKFRCGTCDYERNKK